MIVRQSIFVLCALGFLSASSVPVAAAEHRNQAGGGFQLILPRPAHAPECHMTEATCNRLCDVLGLGENCKWKCHTVSTLGSWEAAGF